MPKINELYEKNKNILKKEYESGKSLHDLSNKYKIPITTLHRNMKKAGVIFRELKDAQTKQIVRINPFLDLSKEEVQYWLGFFVADGGISSVNNDIVLNLSEKDISHIEKYRNFIDIRLPIYKIEKTHAIRVVYANKSIKEYLVSLGITPKKSKTVKIQFVFDRHFIRGLFDGDGCISAYSKKSGNYKWSLVTGSKEFSTQIKTFLDSNNVDYRLSFSNNLWIFSTSKKSSIQKLYNILYKDASIYLTRKYTKMQAAIQEIV